MVDINPMTFLRLTLTSCTFISLHRDVFYIHHLPCISSWVAEVSAGLVDRHLPYMRKNGLSAAAEWGNIL